MGLREGDLEADGRTLTLRADGPTFTPEGKLVPGKTSKFRDVIAFQDDDNRTLTSFMQGDDGEWMQIMQARYRRRSGRPSIHVLLKCGVEAWPRHAPWRLRDDRCGQRQLQESIYG